MYLKISGDRRTPFIVADLFWKPFDARFQDLLQDFAFHEKLLKDELVVAQLQDVRTVMESIAEERLRAAKERLHAADGREEMRRTSVLTEEMKSLLEQQHQGTSKHSVGDISR